MQHTPLVLHNDVYIIQPDPPLHYFQRANYVLFKKYHFVILIFKEKAFIFSRLPVYLQKFSTAQNVIIDKLFLSLSVINYDNHHIFLFVVSQTVFSYIYLCRRHLISLILFLKIFYKICLYSSFITFKFLLW